MIASNQFPTILGWSLDQWAIAFARIRYVTGGSIVEMALGVRKEWRMRYGYEPEAIVEGIKYETDYDLAADLFGYNFWSQY